MLWYPFVLLLMSTKDSRETFYYQNFDAKKKMITLQQDEHRTKDLFNDSETQDNTSSFWDTYMSKHAAIFESDLDTITKNKKEELHNILYDTYMEFVGENIVTPKEFYKELINVSNIELERTTGEYVTACVFASLFTDYKDKEADDLDIDA